MSIHNSRHAGLFLASVFILVLLTFYACRNENKNNADDFEQINLPLANPTSDYDTFYIPIDSFNQMKPTITDNFYVLSQRNPAGLVPSTKALAGPGIFSDLFMSGLSDCGIPLNSNSVLTQYFNINLGDVYKIENSANRKRVLKEKVISMRPRLKTEWISEHDVSVSQCGAIHNPERKDSIFFKAFKIKLESLISNYSLAKVEMGRVLVQEVETAWIRDFLNKNPDDIISRSVLSRGNYMAIRTITIPELTFTFVSKRNKSLEADAGGALEFLDINTAYFERVRTSNDTMSLKFKNINAVTDFIGYDKKASRKN